MSACIDRQNPEDSACIDRQNPEENLFSGFDIFMSDETINTDTPQPIVKVEKQIKAQEPIIPDTLFPEDDIIIPPGYDINYERMCILTIIKESLNGWNWNKGTDEKLLERIESIAAKHNTTILEMQRNSVILAKHMEYMEYKYIEIKKQSYSKASYLIYTDANDNIWVSYNNRIPCSKHNPTGDLFRPTAMKLMSCLGPVYLKFNIDFSDEHITPNLPNNIVQITNGQNFTNLPLHLKGFYNSCIKNSYYHLMHGQLKYLLVATDQNIHLIPPSTETLIIYINKYKHKDSHLNIAELINIPYGVKHLELVDTIMASDFHELPPTIESLKIDKLYTQLRGFPAGLKKLIIDYVIHPNFCNEADTQVNFKVKPECFIICNEVCSEGGMHTWYNYKFDHIEFNDGFEELGISMYNVDDILPYITHIPASFKTISIIKHSWHCYHEYNFTSKYEYVDIEKIILEIIPEFQRRFPQVKIKIVYPD
jgi:hypothetical protein